MTVPYVESPEPAGCILHRTRRPNPESLVDAIPITSVERALFDIAPKVPDRVLEKAARSAMSKGLTTPDKMDLEVATYGGRGGGRNPEDAEGHPPGGSRQIGERWRDRSEAHHPRCTNPKTIQQLRVRLPDGTNAYPDFAWNDRMRIVEVDGFSAHGTPEQLQQDLRRQNLLMDLGWEIRRFTATEIREHFSEVRARVIQFVNKPFCEGL